MCQRLASLLPAGQSSLNYSSCLVARKVKSTSTGDAEILRYYFDWQVKYYPSQAALQQHKHVRLAYHYYGLLDLYEFAHQNEWTRFSTRIGVIKAS